jgi:hypothetical protein
MQGLAELKRQCALLRFPVVDMNRILTRTGTPAMRARGRKLLPEARARGVHVPLPSPLHSLFRFDDIQTLYGGEVAFVECSQRSAAL